MDETHEQFDVEFSTWTPHWFGALAGPVEALAIFGPQGERVHLHD
jgi:hypothetical protein